MIKKFLISAALFFFSLQAFANVDPFPGYTQYNFIDGDLDGYIIQHTDDKTVASYSIHAKNKDWFVHFYPSFGSSGLYSAS